MPEPTGSDQAWEDASFEGAARALRRRVASWTPDERLAWLDAVVLEVYRSGLLLELRARKQEEVLTAWSS